MYLVPPLPFCLWLPFLSPPGVSPPRTRDPMYLVLPAFFSQPSYSFLLNSSRGEDIPKKQRVLLLLFFIYIYKLIYIYIKTHLDRATKQPSNRAPERQVIEWPSDRATEQSNDRAIERSSNRAIDRTTDGPSEYGKTGRGQQIPQSDFSKVSKIQLYVFRMFWLIESMWRECNRIGRTFVIQRMDLSVNNWIIHIFILSTIYIYVFVLVFGLVLVLLLLLLLLCSSQSSMNSPPLFPNLWE